MMKQINDWLPWVSLVVIYIAGKIASYYDYAQQNDPEIADKIKHIATIAKWAVADQSRHSDKTGQQKFDDAVAQVVKNTGTTEQIAKGAVQANYIDQIQNNQEAIPVVLPKVEQPIEVVAQPAPEKEVKEPATPAELEKNKLLDDLG